MKRRVKPKSVRTKVTRQFFMMFFIMAVIFAISYGLKNNLIQDYNASTKTNLKVSRLSIEIDKSIESFEMYLKEPVVEYYETYFESSKEVDEILSYFESNKQNEEISIYLRNLRNMYDYHLELVQEIIVNKKYDADTYHTLVELKTLFGYMNKHAQKLSTIHLSHSSTLYAKKLSNYKTTEDNIYTFLILFGLITALMITKSIWQVTSTIDELSVSAGKLSKAEYHIPDIEVGNYIELNTLAVAFNRMKKNIRYSIEELNKKAELESHLNKARLRNIEQDKLLKESQLKALQVQMDPHFLFNTLNTVSRTAMFEEAEDTVKLIESVSKIMRYNLTHMGKMVSINDEILVLRAYAMIQETRFQDQMTCTFEIEDDLEDIHVPPMIIQPIIENAMIHGLSQTEKNVEIKLSIKKDEQDLLIKVTDNGVGIVKDVLKAIESDSYENQSSTSTGIGLSGIRKRLKLYYDRDDLLTIISKEDVGTEVCVRIPMGGLHD